MMKTLLVFILILFASGDVICQDITTVNIEGLMKRIQLQDDTVYVVNFWATWCRPCIEELPYIEEINKKYMDKKVRVLLVSLDFPEQIKSKLKPFIRKNKLKSRVIHLDDPNENAWINGVDSSWTGSIPATMIYKNGNKKLFHEGRITTDQISSVIESSGI